MAAFNGAYGTVDFTWSMSMTSKDKWIKQTRERAAVMNAAADRVETGERPVDVIGGWAGCNDQDLPLWAGSIDSMHYYIKPKRTLRPWTAKEWGARIGDEFLFDGSRCGLVKVTSSYIEFTAIESPCCGGSVPVGDSHRYVKQLDGSPCGVFEEVKQ